MKKLLLALLAVLLLSGCSKQNEEISSQPEVIEEIGEIAGGWTINTSLPEMNDMVFDSARKKLLGVNYSPLFDLGSKVVNGKMHMYLAYASVVSPDAKQEYKLVSVLEDNETHEGTIENIFDFNITDYVNESGNTTPEGLMGGWQDVEQLPNMLSEQENEVFTKALEGLTGVGYTPVATLATQVVAGTNYAFLALGKTVTATPVTHLYVINIYADLNGNAKLNNICGIDLSTYGAK